MSDDSAGADSATGLVQRRSEDGQEDDWGNDGLEGEEVLDLGVRNAQERQLEQKVEEKADHASGRNALVEGNMVGNVGVAWPNSREQDSHALSSSRCLYTEPNNGKNTTGQDDEVAEVITEWHTCEYREGSVELYQVSMNQTGCLNPSTYSGTHSAVDSDDQTHDEVTENASADGQLPTQADSNDGGSNFPVGHSPGVGHPVSNIGAPIPCSLGGWNWIEISVGSILGSSETACFLSDFKAEVGYASPACRTMGDIDGLDVGGDGRALVLVDGLLVV